MTHTQTYTHTYTNTNTHTNTHIPVLYCYVEIVMNAANVLHVFTHPLVTKVAPFMGQPSNHDSVNISYISNI